MTTGALDQRVRLVLFARFADTGAAPAPEEIAGALGAARESVDASLQRLAQGRVIVLAPGTANIWMANPFSTVPTDFRVEARGRTYFGNCIWDGLGVLALLHADGAVRTHCPDCGDRLQLMVRGGRLEGEGLVHFAVPAARWWDNIGYT